jgi:HSP20 family molecular chaperone IbpA
MAVTTMATTRARALSPGMHRYCAMILMGALLPVAAWGQGLAPWSGDWNAPPYAGPAPAHHYASALHIETSVTGDGYFARIRLDGLRPEDIQVYPGRGYLVVQVEEGDRQGPFRPESRHGPQWQLQMHRRLRLPYNADVTRMKMSTEDGVMEVFIPYR